VSLHGIEAYMISADERRLIRRALNFAISDLSLEFEKEAEFRRDLEALEEKIEDRSAMSVLEFIE